MAISSAHPHPLAFPVGILGNIISVMVYLAPMPTFYRIYKKKSTEGFQSIPYLVALFSSMMWIYYAFLKSDAFLLITINSIGCFIESFYITIFIIYAPKQARILTAKILVLLNFGSFCLIYLLTFFLVKGSNRVQILGWICVVFSACVFAAPLSIVRLVIRTKSVEFMPFSLSFFLTMSAILWFSYGLLLEDIFIAIPNILGFLFGVVQMLLYVIYKNMKKVVEEEKLDHQNGITTSTTTTTTSIDHHHVIRLSSMGSAEVHPIDLQLIVLDHINTITMGHHHDGDDDDLDRQNMHQQVTTADDDDHQIGGGVGEMQNEAGDPISGGEKYSDLNLVVQV